MFRTIACHSKKFLTPKSLVFIKTHLKHLFEKIYKKGKENVTILIDIFTKRNKGFLIVIHLQQDLDILIPMIKILKNKKIAFYVYVKAELLETTTRIQKFLENESIVWFTFTWLDLTKKWKLRTGISLLLKNAICVLSASDLNVEPHFFCAQLVKQANIKKIPTFVFQHGLELAGLTYFDHIHTPENIEFLSQVIFTWCPKEAIHPLTPQKTISKCVPIGYFKDLATHTKTNIFCDIQQKKILILENLHWHRYDEFFRDQFLDDLKKMIAVFPNTMFILKPHHTGMWAIEASLHKTFSIYHNIVIINPSDSKWEPFTAPALIQLCDAVISTPSTTVLDACALNKPIAVVLNNLNTQFYHPLRRIYSEKEWSKFIEDIVHSVNIQRILYLGQLFFQKMTVSANKPATELALDYILKYMPKHFQKSNF